MPSAVNDVTADQAHRLAGQAGVVLLDVREQGEWDAGHAPQARHQPLVEVRPGDFANLRVLAVCRSGRRSGKAARVLAEAGVDVQNVAGGMLAWAEIGLPVVRTDGTPGDVA